MIAHTTLLEISMSRLILRLFFFVEVSLSVTISLKGQMLHSAKPQISLRIRAVHWHLIPKSQLISWKHHLHINEAQIARKHRKKINFIKIVFVSISINRDMVLKWKLGQLVWTDLLPLKRISFSSTHHRSIVQ